MGDVRITERMSVSFSTPKATTWYEMEERGEGSGQTERPSESLEIVEGKD